MFQLSNRFFRFQHMPPPTKESGPPSTTVFLEFPGASVPNRTSITLVAFAQCRHVTDRQTQTHHATGITGRKRPNSMQPPKKVKDMRVT